MKGDAVQCPITKVAQLLSDTWTMLIMHYLLVGPQRFCDLERSLEGISTRTLTLKLQKLVEEGLILKNSDGMYEATKKGKGLRLIENAMRTFDRKYLAQEA